MRRDEGQRHRAQEERDIRTAPPDVDRLDAAEPDRADHQEGGHQHHRERRERRLPILEAVGIEIDGGGITDAAAGDGIPTK